MFKSRKKRYAFIATVVSVFMQGNAADTAWTYSSALNDDLKHALAEKGKEIITQIYDDQPVAKDVYEQFKELNNPQYLYAPVMANAEIALWVRGFMSMVTSDPQAEERKNYLMTIVCIAWALDSYATQKGQPFARGSFTLIDCQHKLLNYLKGYVTLCTGAQDPKTLAYAKTTSNFAYRRDPNLKGSSHYKEHSPDSQFGIDARFENSSGVLKIFPHGHSHILFGLIRYSEQEKNLTFFKMEEIGIGNFLSAVAHGFNLAQSGKNLLSTRREKDVPEVVKDMYVRLSGRYYSCEFKWVKDMYIALKSQDKILESESETELKSGLANFFFKQAIKEGYDYPDIRKGSEVILDCGSLKKTVK
ncbi:MAG: hypothetical protein NEHIOOID_00017 [Holosporales bacterium]